MQRRSRRSAGGRRRQAGSDMNTAGTVTVRFAVITGTLRKVAAAAICGRVLAAHQFTRGHHGGAVSAKRMTPGQRKQRQQRGERDPSDHEAEFAFMEADGEHGVV